MQYAVRRFRPPRRRESKCKSLEVDKRSAFRRNAAPRWREGRGTPAHGEAIPRPRPTPRAGRYGAASAERERLLRSDCGSAGGRRGAGSVRCLPVNCDESHQSTPASCSWAICRGRIGAPCLLGRARHCSARLFPSFPLLPLSRRRERLSARRPTARRRAGSSTRLRRLFVAPADRRAPSPVVSPLCSGKSGVSSVTAHPRRRGESARRSDVTRGVATRHEVRND